MDLSKLSTTEFSERALEDFMWWLGGVEALPEGVSASQARKTRGSGNQDHAPGDLTFNISTDLGLAGRYLLEHKATFKKQRSVSMKELTKLRQEAHSVGRIPAFGLSFYDAATGRFTHTLMFF